MNKLTDFAKGIIAGILFSVIIFSVAMGLIFSHKKEKELIENAKKQMEIEAVREDYSRRSPVEFIDTIPDVRRAADGAAAEFERKRDKALQRFRSRIAD